MAVIALPKASARRVMLAGDDGFALSEVSAVLSGRGLEVSEGQLGDLDELQVAAVAYCPAQGLNVALAKRVSDASFTLASAGTPLVIHARPPAAAANSAELEEFEVASAYLRSHGAIIAEDPDVWVECLALLCSYGVPPGPEYAVLTPEGSWLAAALAALEVPPRNQQDIDVLLVDEQYDKKVATHSSLQISLAARPELSDKQSTIIGASTAISAVRLCGGVGKRVRESTLGPDSVSSLESLSPDLQRASRQLEKLGLRGGDHETKVLMAAFGINVIRQAVATTPSAAARLAKRAGYPVEMKPWGPEVPAEHAGCPVESELSAAAQVRRAYASLQKKMEGAEEQAVIIRETPPRGRELRVRITNMARVGWMTIVHDDRGHIATAPAPLRLEDAMGLSRIFEATRTNDAPLDLDNLGDTLRRLSFLAVRYEDRIRVLHAHRLVVGTSEHPTTVIDASADLSPP